MNNRWKIDRQHKIINAYELPQVKKLIKPSIDEQVQYTDIGLNSRVLIVGGSGTGHVDTQSFNRNRNIYLNWVYYPWNQNGSYISGG
jgi:hypothetical protein